MSDEQRPPMPDQPTTITIPAMSDRALLEDLRGTVKDGFRLVNANIEVVSNDLGMLKQRVSIIEGLRTEDAMRASNLSGGVRGLSLSNAEQDEQLAQEKSAREALAKKVDALTTAIVDIIVPILKRLDELTKTPLVKIVIVIATTVLGSYAASKGLAK